jgi:Voltage-dependent anion channel
MESPIFPKVLFWLNALFLAGLAAATGARLLRYSRAFAADIQSPSRAVGFLTTAAATAVFGTQLVLQMDATEIAAAFWIAAAVLGFVTFYGVLAVLIVKPDKPSLADGLHGGWLVSAVAFHAVAMLTVLVSAAGVFAGLERPLLFAALVLWLGGGALYSPRTTQRSNRSSASLSRVHSSQVRLTLVTRASSWTQLWTSTSALGVRRVKAALSSGCEPRPATAPGSNRSSHGGNEVAEAFD